MRNFKRFLAALPTAALAGLTLFPVWFCVTGAFSAGWELVEKLEPIFGGSQEWAGWSLLPQAPSLQSVVEVLLDTPGFHPMFWNSVAMALGILAGQLLLAAPAAWGLAKLPMRGRGFVDGLYIALMLMPFQVLMYPQYLVLRELSLLDTRWAVILPGVFSTYPVFLLRRFFQAIPEEVLEAARLDGAGEGRLFVQIGLPLAGPGLGAVGILSFLDAWNMIEQPMTYLKTKALWPLSLFLPELGLSDVGLGFGAALLMLIPALLLFAGCEDHLERGIALTGGRS